MLSTPSTATPTGDKRLTASIDTRAYPIAAVSECQFSLRADRRIAPNFKTEPVLSLTLDAGGLPAFGPICSFLVGSRNDIYETLLLCNRARVYSFHRFVIFVIRSEL
jgi:hypothetical protein